MWQAVKDCGLSREQIVDGMNGLAERYGVCLIKGNGKGLTLETFEKWINPGDTTRQIPVKALPIFNRIVRSLATLDVLARPMGARVIDAREAKLLEWAERYMRKRADTRAMKKLEAEIDI